MSYLYKDTAPKTLHHCDMDRSKLLELEKQQKLLTSSTLYVGNLSFFTTEEQIWELFSKAGELNRVIMGINKETKENCGFCFVEFKTHQEAVNCINFVNSTKLDDRLIRIDWDPGFVSGREFGRGAFGGQRREDFRTDFDPGRGGYGIAAQQEFLIKRENEQKAEEREKKRVKREEERKNKELNKNDENEQEQKADTNGETQANDNENENQNENGEEQVEEIEIEHKHNDEQ